MEQEAQEILILFKIILTIGIILVEEWEIAFGYKLSEIIGTDGGEMAN